MEAPLPGLAFNSESLVQQKTNMRAALGPNGRCGFCRGDHKHGEVYSAFASVCFDPLSGKRKHGYRTHASSVMPNE